MNECMFTGRETERNREKQRETERNREKQRETERNREKQRETVFGSKVVTIIQ
jgi:hypothetical protein